MKKNKIKHIFEFDVVIINHCHGFNKNSKILIVKSLKFYLFLQMGGTLQQQPGLASMLPGLTAIMIQLINCHGDQRIFYQT